MQTITITLHSQTYHVDASAFLALLLSGRWLEAKGQERRKAQEPEVFNVNNFPRAERYDSHTEFANVKPGQWVISLGAFSMPYPPTSNGFLWRVESVEERQSAGQYLKAQLLCPTTKEIHKLPLSMLCVCDREPSARFIEDYNQAHNAWLNRP